MAFLPPEIQILRYRYCTTNNDMYAIGLILHELCALKDPYDGKSKYERFINKHNEDLNRRIPTHYSDSLNDIIYKLTPKLESSRPSAEEALRMIEELIEEQAAPLTTKASEHLPTV